MRVRDLLALARWPNALLAAAGVAFGAWWVGGGPTRSVVLAVLAALPLTAAANAWNDIADLELDRRAHPERPLPSGRLGARAARGFARLSALAGTALATAADLRLGALTVVVVGGMAAYSPWLKRSGLPGNAAVAVLGSLPFLYGGWAAGDPRGALVLVAIGAPLHFARELAKDLEDAPADAAARRTLPVVAGARGAAATLVAASLVFLLLLTPYVAARPAFAAAALPAMLLIGYGAWAAVRGRRGAPRAFKLAMLCAMAAFLVARP